MTMDGIQDGRISVLRLVPAIVETSAPYNQFSLPLSDRQDITLCTYFQPQISVPATIKLFAGDGSLRGFLHALKTALDAGEYDVIHAHLPSVSFFFAARAMFTDRSLMRRTVHTVHSAYANYKPRNRLMLLPVLALYRRVVFCSHSSFESFPRSYRWLAGDRACVIRNGVDLSRLDRAIEAGLTHRRNKSFRILMVGRLISLKKPISILRAFHQARIPAAELVFVGEGPLREKILIESQNLGVQDRVTITGLIKREAVYEHLAKAKLFVSTSTVEGLPVAVLEAMACKCPVILSDIPPHREIAGGNDFIPLIPPDDVPGFAHEIERFWQMSSCDRTRVGELCRNLVEGQFSLSIMHRQYEEIYAQVRN